MGKICATGLSLFIILALFTGITFGLYETSTPWTMHRHDNTRTGATASTAPNSNQTLWKYTNDRQVGPPVIADGVVIVRDPVKIVGLDETTGVKIWQTDTYTGLAGTPTYFDGKVYIGSNQGYVYCFNATNGAEIWDYDVSSGQVETSVIVSNGLAIFGTYNDDTLGNRIWALNATTSSYEWHYGSLGAMDDIRSYPCVDGDLLFFGSDDGMLRALNISGPAPLLEWQIQTGGRVRSNPTVYEDKVFIGTSNSLHSVFAIDKNNGDFLWKYELTSSWHIDNGLAIANGIIYFGSNSANKVYAIYANATVGINYTETDPAIRIWSTTLDEYYPTSISYAERKVFFGAYQKLYALDSSTGNVNWVFDWETGSYPSVPHIADGRLFVSRGYDVHCFGAPYPPLTYVYTVTHDIHTFKVKLVINATPGPLDTSAMVTLKKISFDLEGITGTGGMSNITIPHQMLGGPYTLRVDGGLPADQAIVDNGTHSFIYLEYLHSIHNVEITGDTVIPELPSMVILPLLLSAVVAVAYLTKKRLPKN